MPIIGDALLLLLRGGADVTEATLSRFFGIHVLVLPLVARRTARRSISCSSTSWGWRTRSAPEPRPRGASRPAGAAQAVLPGLHPRRGHRLVRVLLAILVVLASIFPAGLEEKADPLDDAGRTSSRSGTSWGSTSSSSSSRETRRDPGPDGPWSSLLVLPALPRPEPGGPPAQAAARDRSLGARRPRRRWSVLTIWAAGSSRASTRAAALPLARLLLVARPSLRSEPARRLDRPGRRPADGTRSRVADATVGRRPPRRPRPLDPRTAPADADRPSGRRRARRAASTATRKVNNKQQRSPTTGRRASTARRASAAPTATAAIPPPTRSPWRWPRQPGSIGVPGARRDRRPVRQLPRRRGADAAVPGLPTDQYSKYCDERPRPAPPDGERHARSRSAPTATASHDVKKASDPTADVYPLNVPALCASLPRRRDDDGALRHPDRPVRRSTSRASTGRRSSSEQDLRAPTLRLVPRLARRQAAAQSTRSSTSAASATPRPRRSTSESRPRASSRPSAPKCWTCHGTHDVAQPDERLFLHEAAPRLPLRDLPQPDRTRRSASSSTASRTRRTGAATPATTSARSSTRRSRRSPVRSAGRATPTTPPSAEDRRGAAASG